MSLAAQTPRRGLRVYLTGTGRRLLVGFGTLVVLLGVATWQTSRGLNTVRRTCHQMRTEEQKVRIVLQLASAVRDQYAHQAHTILLGNESHVPLYREARARVLRLLAELDARKLSPGERRAVSEIRASSDEMDRAFKTRILPAVVRHDFPAARKAHDKELERVLLVQDRTDALSRHSEAAIAAFEARVAGIQRGAYLWSIGILLGAVLFAALMGVWISRSVARPVVALEAGAARLAGGDLDTHIDVDGNDEFSRLAGQFNAMTEALRRHQAELVKSERLAGIGRLAAGVAHEINNPLGVILGYARILEKKADAETRADLEVIIAETRRTQEIVEGLLDLSRPWDPGGDAVDLRRLADEAASHLKDSGEAGEVAVEVKGAGQAVATPRAVNQVLSNLIRNGVEAAGPGGRVTVTVENGTAETRVVVEDTGPGLDEATRARLFEPFFTTKEGGTGLGLAVSQAIARSHGGRLEAEDTGSGARFVLVLPAAKEAGRR